MKLREMSRFEKERRGAWKYTNNQLDILGILNQAWDTITITITIIQ